MGEETTTKRGRPAGTGSGYDPDFVRDISVQLLIGHYNERQDVLRKLITRDPDYTKKLRTKAATCDADTLAWLIAMDQVPKSHPNYTRELRFRRWTQRLEPAWPKDKLDRKPEHEAYLRGVIEKHFTDEDWRVNCKRWVEAIERVRTDKCLTLKVPPTIDPDEGDDFL